MQLLELDLTPTIPYNQQDTLRHHLSKQSAHFLEGGNDMAIGNGQFTTRTAAKTTGKKAFTLPLKNGKVYPHVVFTYSIRFDKGFDFGSVMTARTGMKLPGAMRGNPSQATGGNLIPKYSSGRLMTRGLHRSGHGNIPPDGVALISYLYVNEIGGEPHAKYGRSHFFRRDGKAHRTSGSGTGPGRYGDPNAIRIKDDTWYDLVLVYHADSADGYFQAWMRQTSTETRFTEVLHVPNVRWDRADQEGFDRILMQNYWGGRKTEPEWRPQTDSQMRFRNVAVFDDLQEAFDYQNGDTVVSSAPVSKPAATKPVVSGAPKTMRLHVTATLEGTTGEELFQLDNGTDRTPEFGVNSTQPWAIDYAPGDPILLRFVNDGKTRAGKDRNARLVSLKVGFEGRPDKGFTVGRDAAGYVSTATFPFCGKRMPNEDLRDSQKGWMHCPGHLDFTGMIGEVAARPDPAPPTATPPATAAEPADDDAASLIGALLADAASKGVDPVRVLSEALARYLNS